VRAPLAGGVAVALILGIGAGSAFGFLTGTGHGSGLAVSGTDPSVTVMSAIGTVASKLYPGARSDLIVTLDNPNNYSVTITSVVGNGAVTASGGIGPCATTGVSVPVLTGLQVIVAAGNNVSVAIPNGVSMDTTSDSGCQNATFQIPVTITVEKR
jgi:hypothetical protein